MTSGNGSERNLKTRVEIDQIHSIRGGNGRIPIHSNYPASDELHLQNLASKAVFDNLFQRIFE